jgi:hypothetical protein
MAKAHVQAHHGSQISHGSASDHEILTTYCTRLQLSVSSSTKWANHPFLILLGREGDEPWEDVSPCLFHNCAQTLVGIGEVAWWQD